MTKLSRDRQCLVFRTLCLPTLLMYLKIDASGRFRAELVLMCVRGPRHTSVPGDRTRRRGGQRKVNICVCPPDSCEDVRPCPSSERYVWQVGSWSAVPPALPHNAVQEGEARGDFQPHNGPVRARLCFFCCSFVSVALPSLQSAGWG